MATHAHFCCQSVGIKVVPTAEIIFLAKTAAYDSVFIELEHSTFPLTTASALCSSALAAGITPFVRVPHQCGNGLIQRVLDNGAMGVVFPHIKTVGGLFRESNNDEFQLTIDSGRNCCHIDMQISTHGYEIIDRRSASVLVRARSSRRGHDNHE